MTAFVYLAAAGVATWVLRILFIDLVPAGRLPARFRSALVDAGPAGMAALLATEFDHVQLSDTAALVPWIVGVAIAALFAARTQNLAIVVAAGTFAYWGATFIS